MFYNDYNICFQQHIIESKLALLLTVSDVIVGRQKYSISDISNNRQKEEATSEITTPEEGFSQMWQ